MTCDIATRIGAAQGVAEVRRIADYAVKPDFGGEMPEGFDPGNMPEGFDPGNMPDGVPPFGDTEKATDEDKTGSSAVTNAEEASAEEENIAEKDEEKAAPADGGKNNAPESNGRAGGGERPQMGGFPSMNGSSRPDNTAAYILLGVSALALLLGLGFALKFKR